MIKHMPNSFEIRTEDIPLCPQCGAPLIPYLRCDDKFVEGPSRNNFQEFKSFIIQGHNKNIVFLELGVGYNTPVIIRYPFESLTNEFPHAHLIRINLTCAEVPKKISDKAVLIQEDLAKVLNDLLMMKRNKPIH